MICLKGRYGPSVEEKIETAVNQIDSIFFSAIPDPNALLNGDIATGDMIDLEEFLEILISEHSKALLMIDHLHDIVFKDCTNHNIDVEWPDLSLIGFSGTHANNRVSSAIQLRIFEMNELFHRFIHTDDDRTGLIDCTVFESIISCLVENPLTSLTLKNLVRECKKTFFSDNGNRISYIDFWAIMLAYFVQRIGSCTRIEEDELNSLPRMALTAVREIKRGLEETQAKALVVYFGYVQCVVEDSRGNSKFDRGYHIVEETEADTMMVQSNGIGEGLPLDGKSLPLDGVWSMNAVQASDSPGLLSVVKFIGGNEQLRKSTPHVMSNELSHQPIPIVPLRALPSVQIEKVDLHPIDIIWNEDTPQSQFRLKTAPSTNGLPPLNDNNFPDELPETMLTGTMLNEGSMLSDVVEENEEMSEAGSEMNRVTCTEIEGLRIAQLLRGHEMVDKLKVEKELMERRRAKRQASLHPYGKPVRKVPKRRAPLAGYDGAVPYSARKIEKPVTPPLTPKEITPRSATPVELIIPVEIEEVPLPDEPIVISPIVEIIPEIPISIQVTRENSELRREDSERKSPETPDSGSASATPRENEEEELEEVEVEEEEERVVEQEEEESLPEPIEEVPVVVVVPQLDYVAPGYIVEQRKKEAAEKYAMSLNDISYDLCYIEKVEVEEDEEESSSEEGSEEESIGDFASSAAKRIFNLRTKLNDVSRSRHTRRSDDDSGAFFPMMFSDDLVFYPFNAQGFQAQDVDRVVTVKTSNEGKTPNEDRNEGPFGRSPRSAAADCSDIQQVIVDRKSQLEKDRLTQLYRTSLADVASENWTPMVRTEGADWEAFMELEKTERLRPQTVEIKKQADENDAIISKEFFEARLKHVKDNALDGTSTIRIGDKEDGPASPTPVPLSFGKMYRGLCEINQPEYFYVQVTNPNSILTIELHCQQGFADLYSAFESLPTTLKFSNRATCTLENSRRARITFAVKTPGSIGILVYSSSTGASYSIWAYQSDDTTGMQPAIKHTDNLVKAFNRLIETKEDLSFHLPRLLAEAHKKVNLEESMTPMTISAIIQFKEEYEAHTSITLDHSEHSDYDSDDEADQSDKSKIDVIENLIFKKGKNIIKNAIKDGDRGIKDDPNVNPDLLLPWSGEDQAGVLWESEETVHFPPITIRKPRPEDMKKRVRRAMNRPSLKSPTPVTYTINKEK
eukprot:CAMPEP_0119049162 /NCGR_PEP_ID=MMETSP1177-20130426/63174_1 /TAXON_ID=2985 /ORGANISM="Ochromonas sp, Strain CCMP1899" /LENGTH=1191 /DNA_ID=CAMNT_0007026049 /DNA_START=3076 /DNA_END=6651 /DNA_ORIENTATION=-